ncbi:nickel-responsive transcriptional regulator NikR [bacterium]|nr:nickel-responsive transcriptional regulator NikR [bacterium]
MDKVTRFSISMNTRLLDQFDTFILESGYSNRSEAVRDLLRDRLVQSDWDDDETETVGTLTLIYDHHQRELQNRLTNHQHQHYTMIISTMHVHLDQHHCLEVLAVKGTPGQIHQLANEMRSLRGVIQGKLVMATTGKNL